MLKPAWRQFNSAYGDVYGLNCAFLELGLHGSRSRSPSISGPRRYGLRRMLGQENVVLEVRSFAWLMGKKVR
jgi:hypothetical protein